MYGKHYISKQVSNIPPEEVTLLSMLTMLPVNLKQVMGILIPAFVWKAAGRLLY
jgi:hypothetical protein